LALRRRLRRSSGYILGPGPTRCPRIPQDCPVSIRWAALRLEFYTRSDTRIQEQEERLRSLFGAACVCVFVSVWILFRWLWRSQICEESVPSGFAICLSNYSTEKLLRRVFCCWNPPVARYLQFNDLEFSIWHLVSCVIRRHGSFFYLVASVFPLSSLSDSAAVLFLLRVLRKKNLAKCSIAPCRVVRRIIRYGWLFGVTEKACCICCVHP